MLDHIIISDLSAMSPDVSSIIRSNADVVDALMKNFVRREELYSEALKSYYANLYATLMNAGWLRQHPRLFVMNDAEIKREIEVSSRAVPNRRQRIAEALAKEPRHLKLINRRHSDEAVCHSPKT
jgi:hypothetical protein